MSTADRLLHALRALLAEFRSPEHSHWLTSACADRLEAVLTEHAPPEVGSCANQLAGWLRTQGWQPIETAPSGMPVLLWWPEWSRDPCVGRFVRNRWESDIAVSGAGRLPTHWMPLPAAPVVTQEGEEPCP